ncbi:hypothetical protein [Cytobacillus oceanisediminis]|nr:hypothetical protein [Cytobacillus oceanisediminis]
MARVCEICGRRDETEEDEYSFDILDVCPDCTHDRIHPLTLGNRKQE